MKSIINNTIQNASDRVKNTYSSLNAPAGIPPNVEKFLNDYGNLTIKSIQIQRDSVPSAIQSLVYNISGKTPYDPLFHLRLNMVTTNGFKFLIEKNERINIQSGHLTMRKGGERLDIEESDVPQNVTILQWFNNTKSKMGSKFYSYSASSNNCQNFARDMLLANGINQDKYISFVKQDTEDIFKGNPSLRKFADTVTDIAGDANVVMQGGAIGDFNTLSVKKLRQLIKEYKEEFGIVPYSRLKKADLVTMVNGKFVIKDGKLFLKSLVPVENPFLRTVVLPNNNAANRVMNASDAITNEAQNNLNKTKKRAVLTNISNVPIATQPNPAFTHTNNRNQTAGQKRIEDTVKEIHQSLLRGEKTRYYNKK